MTRRSVLNISSEKKRDNMLSYAAVGIGTTAGPLTMQGGSASSTFGGFLCAWIATARDGTNSTGTSAAPIDKATRTSNTCYMRGLREQIRIATSSSLPWEWRRICFTFKGAALVIRNGTTAAVPLWLETSNGYVRLTTCLTAGSSTSDQIAIATQFVDHIFEGTYGADYSDILTAKVDTTRITPKYDKTISIRSGNDSGVQFSTKRWHGMNHNLVYEDREQGGIENDTNVLSTNGKPGMGDYYVVDFFKYHPSATSADNLSFAPQATLYWHER